MKWLTIPIGGQKWRVDIVRAAHPAFEGDACQGITDTAKCRVWLNRDFEATARDSTLIHEIFGHAAFYVSGAHQTLFDLCGGDVERAAKVEEDMIRGLELVWYPIFQHFGFRFPKGPHE